MSPRNARIRMAGIGAGDFLLIMAKHEGSCFSLAIANIVLELLNTLVLSEPKQDKDTI